jgi:hypothetical protein
LNSLKASAEKKEAKDKATTSEAETAVVSSTAPRAAAAAAASDDGEDGRISTNEMVDLFKMLLAARGKKAPPANEAGSEGQVAVSASSTPAAPQRCNLPAVEVTAGCTSVVALIVGRRLFVANAGDSRAVMCRSGKALGLSEDHKPTQEVHFDFDIF